GATGAQAEAAARAASGHRPAANAPPLRPCRRCGKVTAQPRHVILRQVTGLLRRSLVERIEGVFCRRCSQVSAVRASYATWLRGWWSLPAGPLDTVRALVVNLRGGELPAENNRELLVEQARAFLARREPDLARGCAEQATAFVRTGMDRREVEHLLGQIPRSRRRLRDRWRGPGWAAPVQLLPLLVIGAAVSLVTPRLDEMPDLPMLTAETPAPANDETVTSRPGALGPELDRLNVAAERLTVRTGPGAAYRVAASLAEGTTVVVKELSPDGGWARVLTSDGTTGFVDAGGLRRWAEEDGINP
ncbi:SH3 domain-containing protein, partial [Caenispirillum salinarum]|uniref:SH3 domain-containing protein n=1 Tax=Caenispirillum salinarum TaxID=859058 RepID=UPI00068FFBDF